MDTVEIDYDDELLDPGPDIKPPLDTPQNEATKSGDLDEKARFLTLETRLQQSENKYEALAVSGCQHAKVTISQS